MNTTMRAVVVDMAAPAGLRIDEVASPKPGPGEVVLRVTAASLNRGELPHYPFSGLTTGDRPGWDCAGVVVDPGASHFVPGTRVAATTAGKSWAEFVTVSPENCATIPANVSDPQAAAAGIAGVTALRASRYTGSLLGRTVLVLGATSGVGRFLVQFIRLGGGQVTAAVREGKRDSFREELGLEMDQVVHSDSIEGNFDVAYDLVGGQAAAAVWASLEHDGTLVAIGSASEEATSFAPQTLVGSGKSLRSFGMGSGTGSDLDTVLRLIASGQVLPFVSRTASWSTISELADAVLHGGVSGKVVFTVD